MTGSDRFASQLNKSAQEYYNEGKTLCEMGGMRRRSPSSRRRLPALPPPLPSTFG